MISIVPDFQRYLRGSLRYIPPQNNVIKEVFRGLREEGA